MLVLLMSLAPLNTGTGPPDPRAAPERWSSRQTTSPQLLTSVVSGGGFSGSSLSFRSVGSLGQPTPIGVGTATGRTLWAGFWGARQRIITTVMEPAPDPIANRLLQNAPNPFNPSTVIRFTLAKEAPTRLEVYDPMGRRVRTLVDARLPRGSHRVAWDGRDDQGRRLASGLYLYRLHSGSFSGIKKMLLLR